MRNVTSKIVLTLALAAGCAQLAGCASNQAAKPEPAAPSQEEMMAAWQEYMTPGAEHERMAAQSGEYTVAVKSWHEPGQPPEESTGTAKFSMAFDGRYQIHDFAGSMMEMPFTGYGITGFDNATQEFTSVWIDSMSTGTFVSHGKRTGKDTVELSGSMTDPMGTPMTMRMVTTERPDGTILFEMFGTHPAHGADEFRMMEMVYTRATKK